MPGAILAQFALPALFTAGGAVASGVLQNKAAGRAARAQKDASDAALDFERQRYADSQARERRMWDDYTSRRANYDAARSAILARYGIGPGGGGGGGGGVVTGAVGGRAANAGNLGLPGGGAPAPAATNLDIFGGPSGGVQGFGDMGLDDLGLGGSDPTVGDDTMLQGAPGVPTDWSDWSQYGVR